MLSRRERILGLALGKESIPGLARRETILAHARGESILRLVRGGSILELARGESILRLVQRESILGLARKKEHSRACAESAFSGLRAGSLLGLAWGAAFSGLREE